jgi:hypothetical protein
VFHCVIAKQICEISYVEMKISPGSESVASNWPCNKRLCLSN